MKNKQYHKATGLILLGLLLLFGCKRDQLQPAPPSLLSTYHGTDKMVLQVIDQLQQPANRAILAELEKQGSINWQYKALFSSRFIKGYTLRFALGSSGNYLDAEIDAKTGEIKLFTKEMQLQKDQQVKQHFKNSRLKQGNGTLSSECVFFVFFEIHNIDILSPDDWETVIRLLLCDYLAVVGGNLYVQEVYVGSSNYLIIVAPSGTTAEQVEMDLRPDNHPLGDFIDVESLSVIGGCEDENGTIIQDIPPITWEPQNFPVFNEYDNSYTEWRALVPDCEIIYDPGRRSFIVKILRVYGHVYTRIRTGGSRDPSVYPPQTESEAIEAITSMKNYLTEKRGLWHTVAATKAHEAYHYEEYKAFNSYYWPLVAACINKIAVPASGNNVADMDLAQSQLLQVLSIFDGITEAQEDITKLSDVPGERPYQAGQAVLNQTIIAVQQLAASKGWTVPQGITPVPSNISVPPFQPTFTFNCPFF